MGLQSWYTEIRKGEDMKTHVKEAFMNINENPNAYDVVYVLTMDKDLHFKKGSVVIAWEADGHSCDRSIECMKHTIPLEQISNDPKWQSYVDKKFDAIEKELDCSSINVRELDGFLSHVDELLLMNEQK